MRLLDLFDLTYYGNRLQTWLGALAVGVLTYAVLQIAPRFVVGRLRRFASRTRPEVRGAARDLLRRTHFLFLAAMAVYLGSLVLTLPPKGESAMHLLLVVALLLQAAIWGNAFITFWLGRYKEKYLSQDATVATTVTAMGFISRVLLWTVVVLVALQNLGLRIDALLAGLGVGGIAVALAVQNILGDLFASLSIILDKPFLIGDFIVVGDHMGSVEYIGLKTTRLRSLTGEQLIFANSDLLKSRIRNYKRMYERRVVFAVGVTYDTPYEKLQQIPAMLKEIVTARDRVRFERAHFKEYAQWALNFEVVYWVLAADYNLYMDTQQTINLEIFRRFSAEGIGFAMPTSVVLVSQPAPAAPGGSGAAAQ